jgi:hypothetical protein
MGTIDAFRGTANEWNVQPFLPPHVGLDQSALLFRDGFPVKMNRELDNFPINHDISRGHTGEAASVLLRFQEQPVHRS